MFSFPHLKCSLITATKTFKIELLSTEDHTKAKEVYFTPELLENLEQAFSWVSHHTEICSVLLSSQEEAPYLGLGLHPRFDLEHKEFALEFNQYLKKWQRLIFSLYFLPQTVVFDLKQGALNLFAEFSLGADLRIAHEKSHISFDHLKRGLVPCSGGIGFLSLLFSPVLARSLILGNFSQSSSFYKNIGLLNDTYKDKQEQESLINLILQEIFKQGQVERIQAKRSLLEVSLAELERVQDFESKMALAAHSFGDWKEFLQSLRENREVQFIAPQMAAQLLKKIDKLGKQDYSTLI
jgi:enoyl-CoA hydratase/carnithine racemase